MIFFSWEYGMFYLEGKVHCFTWGYCVSCHGNGTFCLWDYDAAWFCHVNMVLCFTMRCWLRCTRFAESAIYLLPTYHVIGCRVATNESLYSGVCGSVADKTMEVVTFCDCPVTGDSSCGQRLDLIPCPRSDNKLSFWEGEELGVLLLLQTQFLEGVETKHVVATGLGSGRSRDQAWCYCRLRFWEG